MPSSVPQLTFQPPEGWDGRVRASATPHLEQCAGWAAAQRERGWRTVWVEHSAGEAVVAAQILERPLGRWGLGGYVARGPIATGPGAAGKVGALLKWAARRRHYHYLAVTPAYNEREATVTLPDSDFTPLPGWLPPSTRMASTLVLSLGPNDDELMAGFASRVRRNIRQGLGSSLKVRKGVERDLPNFVKLVEALCRRRGAQPNHGGFAVVAALWSQFASRGEVLLPIVERDGQPIAAMLLFCIGGWARVWRVGWNGEAADDRPNEIMYWAGLRWARESGCRQFDFYGFDSDYARAVIFGETPGPAPCGMSAFKHGFRGNILHLPSGWCRFGPAPLRWTLQWGGLRLLRSSWVQRFLSRRRSGARGGIAP